MLSRTRGRLGLLAVMAAVLAGPPLAGSAPAAAAASSGWRWPLAGVPTVLRPFEPPPTPYAAGHRGVDLAAPTGAPVLAAGDGVIGFAGMLAGRGVVTVVHGALRTTYEPVATVVHAGQPVQSGQLIGRLQAPTGHCGVGRPCLHWGLLRGQTYLDPLLLLGLTHSILLPVWGRHPFSAGGASIGTGPSTGTARLGPATGKSRLGPPPPSWASQPAPGPLAGRPASEPPSGPASQSGLPVTRTVGVLLTAGALLFAGRPGGLASVRSPPSGSGVSRAGR